MTGNSPKERRESFASRLARRKIDIAVISNPLHVFYFTGFFTGRLRFTSFLIVKSDGESSMVLGESELSALEKVFDGNTFPFVDYNVDQRMIVYPAFAARQLAGSIRTIGRKIHPKPRSIGIEDWHLGQIHLSLISRAFQRVKQVPISEMLLNMRKIKGRDEIECVADAARRLDRAYSVSSPEVKKGNSEVDLYNAANAEFVMRYGPSARALGDYVSGSRAIEMGGPPTRRKIKSGETVILDLQTASDGYWADTARTFVAGRPSANQENALEVVLKAKRKAESVLHPGTKGKEVYKVVSAEISKSGLSVKLPHHAGHGIGLEDQEPPFFLSNSEEVLREGMVVALEPGVYARSSGGIRVEDDYVIERDGFTRLSRFPLRW
jgi:Xaa-Pro dipeptidase